MLLRSVSLLLITNAPSVAGLVQEALASKEDAQGHQFNVRWVTSLAAAIELLREIKTDVIMLDLELSTDSESAILNELSIAAPDALTVALCTTIDETHQFTTNRSLEHGFDDLIDKNHITAYWLNRTLTSLIERRQLRMELRDSETRFRTMSDRKEMELILRVSEEALFDQRERAQVILRSIGDGVLTVNLAGRVSYLNPAAEKMTGWKMKDALGLPLAEVLTIIDSKTHVSAINPIRHISKEYAPEYNQPIKFSINSTLVHRDGTKLAVEGSTAPIHNRNSEVTGTVIVFHDVTETRAITQKMMYMAQHDFLTGLPNRALLTERLTRAIGLAKRKKKQVGVLFVDLDNFKKINDSLGHHIGDQLLQSVAKRMKKAVRSTDTVCRQGGDEFVVLLTEIEHRNDAAHVAEKMIAAFAEPHIIDGKSIKVTLSIGVSIYPDDGNDVASAFHHADTAMYHAKRSGRNNYQFFHTAMTTNKVSALKTYYQ